MLVDNFRRADFTDIEDLGDYCRDYIEKNPEVIVYVGCDSSNERRKTCYTVVVCFRFPNRGVHIIHSKKRIPKIKEIYYRLWKEVEYVLEVSNYLEEELMGKYKRHWTKEHVEELTGKRCSDSDLAQKINDLENERLVEVHIDLNPSPNFKSHNAYNAGLGHLKSFGYRVTTKPQAWAASVAADLLCRK